ncbi:hypothetical protein GCM10009541_35310 [Micromonospora gifhornensis]|uniref:Uncharacterized protein n=1 Tax=Micromonospora gifhornensis TaxID=84594 RepID=A0ABQ4IJM5_9ACTN|nr:hypothetical protein [Micromonospora gifhornensis]GIJ18107.1 hypothetical protein Vgi01_47910 [Micromonospora gifhornensis]
MDVSVTESRGSRTSETEIMSIDLDRPSIAGADMIGLFRSYDEAHGYPTDGDSWARAVVSKIEQDLVQRGAYSWGDVGNNDYTPEELAVWAWYHKQTESDRWKVLVAEYRQDDAKDRVTAPNEFDPEHAYIEKPHVSVEGLAVKPFADVADGRGGIAVNTAAIAYFCNALDAPLRQDGMLELAKAALSDIELRPGGFAVAEKMRQKIVGAGESPGLSGQTITVMDDVKDVLLTLQSDLRELIKRYDETEELNALSVNDLDGAMRRSNARINRLGA